MTTITHNTDVFVEPIERLPGEFFASVRYLTQFSNSGQWNSTGGTPAQAVLNAWNLWTDHWMTLAAIRADIATTAWFTLPAWPNRYFSAS